MRAVLAAVAVLLLPTLLLTAPDARAAFVIQPGAQAVSASGTGCTYNFVFDGAGGPYIGLAAHCVSGVGETWRTTNGVVGTVAYIGDASRTHQDYALVKIASGALPFVSAAVKGHTQWPTSMATTSTAQVGHALQVSGYGTGYGLTQPTQEQRVGVLQAYNSQRYGAVAPVIYGDSGGPLVDIETGAALGIVSRLCINACTVEGPTVEFVITHMAARGVPVSLRTV